MRIAFLVLAVVGSMLTPKGSALAQEAPPDTLAKVVGRSVEELIDGLPGAPIQLGDVVAVALDRNLDLEVARTRRQVADASLQVEQGLFDPAVTLGWGVARDPMGAERSGSWLTGISQAFPWGTQVGLALQGSRAPAGQGVLRSYGTDLALTFSQPLLEGRGTMDVGVRAARALRQSAVAQLIRAQETLVAEVELSYWDLAEAEAIQAVRQRSLEIADALLFRNRQLADRELIPEVDVLTARSAVALRRAGFISARQAREDASERLVFLAWGSGASERLAAVPSTLKTEGGASFELPAEARDPTWLERAALSARQDVVAARAAMQSAEEARRGARRSVLPSLNLDGSVASSATGASLGNALEGLDGQRSWSLGFSFSQPILNRRDRGLGLGADLAVDLRRFELALMENQVRLEARGAFRALEAGQLRHEAASEAAALARAQLEAERRRLELGLGDSFRLLETEENAVQAELEEVRARYDLARAASLYRLATGTAR